jgi:predicted glycoside hydrolase/deacetylase ChbG (UPF0249 family)
VKIAELKVKRKLTYERTLNMSLQRHLIINADDFGQSPGVNRGIIEAHEKGIVTSASLMVRWPAAPEAAAYSRTHPELSVGLHLDFGEWMFRNDTWVRLYEVVPLEDHRAVQAEILHQVELFRNLLGRDPTHIDSHQHVHREDPLRAIVLQLGCELGVPVRHFHPRIRYCGDFYGQSDRGEPFPEGISVDNLILLLSTLPVGITELACHPALRDDAVLEAQYLTEREAEVKTLCDLRIREAIIREGIIPCSFHDTL